jgi:hypothetical protein
MGLRQGDPLSPSLFILAEEVLSRGLSRLGRSGGVLPFSVPRGCLSITHLLFADDTQFGFIVHPNRGRPYLFNFSLSTWMP